MENKNIFAQATEIKAIITAEAFEVAEAIDPIKNINPRILPSNEETNIYFYKFEAFDKNYNKLIALYIGISKLSLITLRMNECKLSFYGIDQKCDAELTEEIINEN